MAEATAESTGLASIAKDWSSDVTTFKGVPWGKAMMWIFLLSDTFIFSIFLTSYMTVRSTTAEAWPNPSEVFSLTIFGTTVPLLLIAIMTFDLITSSGTMALAVNYGYRREKKKAIKFICATAFFGAVFVGMQGFEWTKLIAEGVRPWGNEWGAAQFGSCFFMITGFHGLHVVRGRRLSPDRGVPDPSGLLRQHQLRDRRDRGPVLALRRPRLGVHLRVLLPLVG